MSQEIKHRIENQPRIVRLMKKVCHANMRVILRCENAGPTAIKGRATDFVQFDGKMAIRIANISLQGITILRQVGKVQLEFVGMASKVTAATRILSYENFSVIVQVPKALISLERRNNIRFSTREHIKAFVEFSEWKSYHNDFSSGPMFSSSPHIASLLEVVDVSEGGICVMSRYPSVYNYYDSGMIDDEMTVRLPLEPFVLTKAEVRWKKIVRERMSMDDGSQYFDTQFRIGIQFLELDEKKQAIMRNFIRQLALAEAV